MTQYDVNRPTEAPLFFLGLTAPPFLLTAFHEMLKFS